MSKIGRVCKKREINCICGETYNIQKIKSHILNVHKKKNGDEYDEEYCKILFKHIDIEKLIKEYQNGSSVSDLMNKYGLLFHDINFLFKVKKIDKRNISDVHKTKIYNERIKNTIIKKYGVDNVSKSNEIKQKKINTMILNYGRINNFSDKEILKKAKNNVNYEKSWETLQLKLKEKYGVDKITHIDFVKEKMSITKKNNYINSSDEKKKQIKKHMGEIRKLIKHRFTSKIQTRINNILNDFNYEYTSNKVIGDFNFDIIFKNKKLLEINGDYWHASPIKYKPNDIINYPGGLYLTAKEVWNRDEKKRKSVEKEGYEVFYLWETEINKMSDIEIINFITKNIGL